ncbi:MAG: BPSS1187 family protein [Novosphingobium sp.]
MRLFHTLLLLTAPLALGSCGGSGGSAPPVASGAPTPTPTVAPTPTPSPAATSIERDVLPAVTSPAISTAFSAHFTVTPSPAVAPAGRLFVMLPGTGAIPRFYREVARTGATRGYHGIGLTYPNDVAVGDRCAGNADLDCAAKVRREVVTGDNTSPLIDVTPADSIAGRLAVLLAYMHGAYPTEGWGQFLVGGQLDWSRITVAGHSQGGGHAAFMAKLFVLDRTVMFSSPGDIGQTQGTLAPWMSWPNLTPAARQFGFTHTADELVPLALITANWRLIGLDSFGPATSVDGTALPFGGSHQLVTSAPANPNPVGPVAAPLHASPVVDAATPIAPGGDLLYRPVWIFLAFP